MQPLTRRAAARFRRAVSRAAIAALTLAAIGCASFRESRLVPAFDFTAASDGSRAIVAVIANRFADPSGGSGSVISDEDRDAFASETESLYRESRRFSGILLQAGTRQARHTDYHLIIENELAISENLHPKPTRVLSMFLFTWLDRRKVTVRTTVYSNDGKRLALYRAEEEYGTLGFLLIPIMPLLGKSSSAVKREIFRACTVRVINQAARDGLFEPPKL